MKIHEFQAKELLARFGVPVPRARVVSSPEEAEAAARELGAGQVVVKAQIHAGGRGKAGGVKVVDSPAAARALAERLLGRPLVTHQSGPRGQVVRRLLVEQGLGIARELYAGLVLDRERAQVALIASAEGGVEIEEVARRSPEKILRVHAHPITGLMPYQCRQLAFRLGLGKEQVTQAVALFTALQRAFLELDASLVEVNPLVVTREGQLVALDAKVNFDDNGLFRHKELAALRDEEQEEPAEVEASRHDLSYVRLDGDIGCMVNGAGLAMATMDIIKLYGGEPANFLDVGGGTDAKRVEAAFKIILSDPSVKAILVNIFGGIVRCDTIAQGVVAAVREVGIRVPLVVRLQGTKQAEGRDLIQASGLDIIAAETMQQAAEAAVAAVGRRA
ncbi:MAG TPA: ADP-forming succinate--CoA ligase subunit beta [Myxococcota bacterium]|nr:ADP-forming succinate--CoA ligase subunit beta [Myxococcota bacterium]HRY96528.1 ADP-forming succinate--CoA ligase subunit beta [Myxococcota bacterium]